MNRRQAEIEARKYLAGRKRIGKNFDLWGGLIHRFNIGYREANKMLIARRMELGEMALVDLTPSQRRELIDPANLDLQAIANGPIMDSNVIYLPAGKLSMAETRQREMAAILEARHG